MYGEIKCEAQPGVNSRGMSSRLTEWHDPFEQAEGPRLPPLVSQEGTEQGAVSDEHATLLRRGLPQPITPS